MKNVLALYSSSYPDGLAMAKRLHLYAKSIMQSEEIDFSIAVLRKKNENSPGEIYKLNLYDGVKYYYIKPPILSKSSFVIKIKQTFNGFFVLRHFYKKRNEIDVLWVIGFNWFNLTLLTILAIILKIKVAVEVNEKPYVRNEGRLDNKIIRAIKYQLLLYVTYKMIDGFIVISENLQQLLVNAGISNKKIIKIPILIDPNTASAREESTPKIILHAGTLDDVKDGITDIFLAIALVSKKTKVPFRFILTRSSGDPSIMSNINRIINQNHIGHLIEFNDYLSSTDLEELFRKCSLTIVNRGPHEQNQFNFSTKLGEYMSYGIPVISTNTGEAGNYLLNEKNALIIKSNDVKDLSEKIQKLLENNELAVRIGQGGKEMASKNFDYTKHSTNLSTFLLNI